MKCMCIYIYRAIPISPIVMCQSPIGSLDRASSPPLTYIVPACLQSCSPLSLHRAVYNRALRAH